MNDGAFAEARFAADATALGYTVCLPVFRPAHYDAIVTRGGRVVRVQCKSSTRRKAANPRRTPAYRVELRRTGTMTRDHRRIKKRYPPNAYDVLAIWLAEDRRWLFIPRRSAGSKASLAITPHKGVAKRLDNWDVLKL